MFILVFLAITTAFIVHKDFSIPPYPTYSQWQSLNLNESHWQRQPTQPPQDWYNITFHIPVYAKAVQFTVRHRGDVITENIVYYGVDYYNIYLSVVWWGKPWSLLTGWLIEKP